MTSRGSAWGDPVTTTPPPGPGAQADDPDLLGVGNVPTVAGFNPGRTADRIDEAISRVRSGQPGSFSARYRPPSAFTYDPISGQLFGTVPPFYTAQDPYSTFNGRGRAEIGSIQVQLIQAGLLDPDQVRPGVWDMESAGAMRQVMGWANDMGYTWQYALTELALNPPEGMRDGGSAKPKFTAPAYSPPDYATLSQEVKQLFRSRVRRDPQDYEVSLLADQLRRDHRAAYDAQVAAQRAYFDAQVAGGGGGQTVEADVDPIARLNETFEQRYGPELNRLERVDDATTLQSGLLSSIARIGSA